MEETEIYPQRKIYNKYYILNIFIIYIIYYYISKYLMYIYIYVYIYIYIKYIYLYIYISMTRYINLVIFRFLKIFHVLTMKGKNRSVEKDKKDSKGLKRVDSKKI